MKLKRCNKDKALSKLSNKNNKKIKIGTIICSICLLVGAIIYISFARFESTGNFQLINGTVVDSGDISLVSYMYDEGSGTVEKHNVPPTNNGDYVIDQVTCTNGNGTWDNNAWTITISNITGNVKCNLTFKTVKHYTVLSGDLDTVGSEVKIANEEFYVIGQEDATHVKLLSKWNLNVGSNPKGTATNLQDENVRGYRVDDGTKYGEVEFSDDVYWYDETNSSLRSEYGLSLPVYVYTNAKENGTYLASIAEYVDNYVTYLTQQGVSVTGRLISKEELVTLGCNESTEYCDSSDNHGGTAPGWVYQTSYWTGFAINDLEILGLYSDGKLGIDTCGDEGDWGLRPVIILKK